MALKNSHLGDLEADIMNVVWRREAATVRDVFGTLKTKRRLAYTTVMTVMNRLVDKGLLKRHEQGACFCYQPTRARQAYMAQASRRVIDDLLTSYGSVAVAQFLDRLDITDPKLIERLRRRFPARP